MKRGYSEMIWPYAATSQRLGELRLMVCGRTSDEAPPCGAGIDLQDLVLGDKIPFDRSHDLFPCVIFPVYRQLTGDGGFKFIPRKVEGYQCILSRHQWIPDPEGLDDEIITVTVKYIKSDAQKPVNPIANALGSQAILTATATLITPEMRAAAAGK